MNMKLKIDGNTIHIYGVIKTIQDAEEIKKVTGAIEVGHVEEGNESYLVDGNNRVPLKPMFRESAYTPVKKVVGEKKPGDFEEMKEKVRRACDEAIKKKDFVVELLKSRRLE